MAIYEALGEIENLWDSVNEHPMPGSIRGELIHHLETLYESGRSDGYDTGHNDGYDSGYRDAEYSAELYESNNPAGCDNCGT